MNLDIEPCTPEEVAEIEAAMDPDVAAILELLEEAQSDAERGEIIRYATDEGLLVPLTAETLFV